jgi:flagellum-specific peptidoglycan hydrolase FlgJ
MSTTHSIANTTSTRVFASVATLCVAWLLFFTDWAPLANAELQSPIRLGAVDTEEPFPNAMPEEEAKPRRKVAEATVEPENEAAPISAIDLPPADVKEYIKKYAGIAVEEMRRTGIPASISMAQALVESRAGRSGLALTANNHFGMKCHVKGKCKAGHCINFSDDSDLDYFQVFQNAHKSWKAHSELLMKPRYAKCHKQADYKGWARALKAAGYATDRNYASTLISTIERYKLHLLDKK